MMILVGFLDCLTTGLNDKLPLNPGEWEVFGNPIKNKTKCSRFFCCATPRFCRTFGASWAQVAPFRIILAPFGVSKWTCISGRLFRSCKKLWCRSFGRGEGPWLGGVLLEPGILEGSGIYMKRPASLHDAADPNGFAQPRHRGTGYLCVGFPDLIVRCLLIFIIMIYSKN